MPNVLGKKSSSLRTRVVSEILVKARVFTVVAKETIVYKDQGYIREHYKSLGFQKPVVAKVFKVTPLPAPPSHSPLDFSRMVLRFLLDQDLQPSRV